MLHLANAAILGWSPVIRSLLRRKRRSIPLVDEVEDGGRARVIEEGIAASAYEYAERHKMLKDTPRVDWELLKGIRRLTANLEVSVRTDADWERAITTGFKVFREVRAAGGGKFRAI